IGDDVTGGGVIGGAGILPARTRGAIVDSIDGPRVDSPLEPRDESHAESILQSHVGSAADPRILHNAGPAEAGGKSSPPPAVRASRRLVADGTAGGTDATAGQKVERANRDNAQWDRPPCLSSVAAQAGAEARSAGRIDAPNDAPSPGRAFSSAA